jgi:amino acid transporter
MLILGLLMVGILIDLGAVSGQERLGFRYWKNPGPFVPLAYAGGNIPGSLGNFLSFWSTLVNAAFAYNNVQLVGIAGAESENPRRSIPKAVRRTFIRLCIFYVLTIFVMGLILPSNAPGLTKSNGTAASAPFVLAIKAAGIKVLPGIINGVVMTSACSSVRFPDLRITAWRVVSCC